MIESFKLPPMREETISGAICSFTDDFATERIGIPLKSCTSLISGYQEGSGTPSPDNVRPLHAWSGANLTACGVNLWDEEWESGAYNSSGQKTSDDTRIRSKNFIPVKSGEFYYVLFPNNSTGRAFFYDNNYNFLRRTTDSKSRVIEINAEGTCYITFHCLGTAYNNDVSINYPSTDTSYHAYNGNTYTFTFGQTIYQGSIDWLRGVVVGNMAIATFDGSSDENWNMSGSSGNNQYYITIPNIMPTPSGSSKIGLISSYLPEITPSEGYNYNNINGISGWESGQLRPSFDVTVCPKSLTDFKNYLSTNPLTVAYPLATPIEIPLGGINLLTQEGQNNIFADCGDTTLTRIDFRNTVYGFNIDYTNKTVTYLGDAVGMTPAYMDYTSGEFNYGSWRDAFFMPRPCMLRSNGTVAYYLDENDYTKRADGTASDVGDFSFDGNAMMEWGQKGKRIFYKQVNEANGTISVYIADEQVDPDYHCWSFYDANGNLKDHFYTPIYNGTLDTNGKLRSISGKDYTIYCKGKTGAQEVTAAELNNVGTDKGWYTEVNADWVLMCHLLTLMSKSLDSSTAFGNGNSSQVSAESKLLNTGSMNDKGLFWGSNTGTYGVKVFGMENQWGNQFRRMAGLVLNYNKWYYKLTRNTNDGSIATDYNSDGTNYLTQDGHTAPSTNYVQEMYYTGDGALYAKVTNSTANNTMYKDYFNSSSSGSRYVARGGECVSESAFCGAYYLFAYRGYSFSYWTIGASLTYK